MVKRRWLETEDVRDVAAVESAVMKFFGASSLNEVEVLPHAAKKTATATPVTPAQLAWMYRVRHIASDMVVPRYSPAAVQAAVKKLGDLLLAPEEARKAPRILAECGIRFVIVETIGSAKMDGVCFWLNDFAPVVGMSMRFDRIDNFWFVLRHEIEHVLRRHGLAGAMVDAELEGKRAGVGPEVPEEERLANEAAANFCVPRTQLKNFVDRKAPFFAERDLLGLARTIQVHPGLVAGQLQYATGRYDRFKSHLVKIRALVAPGAMVDGWGDVAPTGA
jgi:HTH-type transcriptional regulator/antitoxin HigA